MRAEVLAVELNWFVDTAGTRALVPRIIGATERAAARRSPPATPSLPSVSKEEWIEQRARPQGDAAARVAQIFFEFADSIGGDLNLRNSWASILVPTNQGGSLNVLAVYPSGKYAVNLDAARRGASLDDDGVRAAIMPLTKVLGPLSTVKLTGYPSFKADAVLDVSQRDTILDAMRQLLRFVSSGHFRDNGAATVAVVLGCRRLRPRRHSVRAAPDPRVRGGRFARDRLRQHRRDQRAADRAAGARSGDAAARCGQGRGGGAARAAFHGERARCR